MTDIPARLPDLTVIRSFLAVAEAQHYRNAATASGIRPGTLSAHVMALESMLGVALFERSPNGTRLTRAGRHLAHDLRRVLLDLETVARNAGRAGRAETGELALGFFTTSAAGNLPSLLGGFQRTAPDVDLQLIEASHVELISALHERRLDIALFAREVNAIGIETAPLWHEQMFVAMPADHPSGSQVSLSWASLANERIVVRRWEHSAEIFAYIAGRMPPGARVVEHRIGRDSVIGLVAAGFGFSIVPESATLIGIPGVTFRPLEDDDARLTITAGWLAENDNPVAQRFLRFARDRFSARPALTRDPSPDTQGPGDRAADATHRELLTQRLFHTGRQGTSANCRPLFNSANRPLARSMRRR